MYYSLNFYKKEEGTYYNIGKITFDNGAEALASYMNQYPREDESTTKRVIGPYKTLSELNMACIDIDKEIFLNGDN